MPKELSEKEKEMIEAAVASEYQESTNEDDSFSAVATEAEDQGVQEVSIGGDEEDDQLSVAADSGDEGDDREEEAGDVSGETGEPEEDSEGEVGEEEAGDVSEQEVRDSGEDVEASSFYPRQEETQEVSRIPDELIEEAVKAGLPYTVVRNMQDEDALRTLVNSVNPPEPEKDLFDGLPELDPDLHDEELIKAFKQVVDVAKHSQSELKEMRAAMEERQRADQQAAQQEFVDWFDDKVNSLGEDYEELLGSGRYSALEPTSIGLRNRDRIAEQMNVLLRGYQGTGATAPSKDELFNQAMTLALAREIAAVETGKLSKKLEKRANQHSDRRSGNKQKRALTPEEETVELLNEQFSHLWND